MTSTKTSISIIGPGALGSALIDLVENHSQTFRLHSVWSHKRTDSYLIKEGRRVQPGYSTPGREDHLGDLVFITCPDDLISQVAGQLSSLTINWSNRSAVHFSGSHSSHLLKPLSRNGASVASLHPLQTFTKGDASKRFSGIWFTLEGDQALYAVLKNFVKQAGANVQELDVNQKKAMHLAAVFASNYLVSLMSAVEQISKEHDIKNPLEMLEPLIRQTLDNIIKKGSEQSLSGPVARGDQTTIQEHLKLMKDQPELKLIYKDMGKQALRLARNSGRISDESFESIQKILSDKDK